MASKTKRTETQRKKKLTNHGRKRKTANQNKGTTLSKKELFGD